MTTRENGLSAGRHHEIGLELARMHDRLTTLSVEIGNAYPKGSAAYRRAMRVTQPLDNLRSELDDRHFAEHPDATGGAYYPPAEQRTP